MFQDWLAQINAHILSHPHHLTLLHSLLWLKFWLFTALMGYFLYLLYKDMRKPAPDTRTPRQPGRFVA